MGGRVRRPARGADGASRDRQWSSRPGRLGPGLSHTARQLRGLRVPGRQPVVVVRRSSGPPATDCEGRLHRRLGPSRYGRRARSGRGPASPFPRRQRFFRLVLPPGTFARLPAANTPVGASKLGSATRQTLPVVALEGRAGGAALKWGGKWASSLAKRRVYVEENSTTPPSEMPETGRVPSNSTASRTTSLDASPSKRAPLHPLARAFTIPWPGTVDAGSIATA